MKREHWLLIAAAAGSSLVWVLIPPMIVARLGAYLRNRLVLDERKPPGT